MCDCLAEVNEKLRPLNTRVDCLICWKTGEAAILVATHQLETGRGKPKAQTVSATFCPFCGGRISCET